MDEPLNNRDKGADDESDSENVLRLQASPSLRGKRLDAALASLETPGLSRSRITALIKAGHATLNGAPLANPAQKLRGEETITLTVPDAEDAEPQPENIPLAILHEDADLIVLNKPAGLVVHPGAGNPSGTLVNALLFHCGDSLSGIGGVKRPGIVHRLDKDTSGVMVVAKTDAAHHSLSAQFADHGKTNDLERLYTAFVWGKPRTQFTVDAALARDPHNRLKMAVSNRSDARHAVTHVQRLESYGAQDRPAISKVECQLETGRTHQIRVHMAHAGHGLVGDGDYGREGRTRANLLPDDLRDQLLAFPRQALQARILQFTHPSTEEVLRFETPLDDDLTALKSALSA